MFLKILCGNTGELLYKQIIENYEIIIFEISNKINEISSQKIENEKIIYTLYNINGNIIEIIWKKYELSKLFMNVKNVSIKENLEIIWKILNSIGKILFYCKNNFNENFNKDLFNKMLKGISDNLESQYLISIIFILIKQNENFSELFEILDKLLKTFLVISNFDKKYTLESFKRHAKLAYLLINENPTFSQLFTTLLNEYLKFYMNFIQNTKTSSIEGINEFTIKLIKTINSIPNYKSPIQNSEIITMIFNSYPCELCNIFDNFEIKNVIMNLYKDKCKSQKIEYIIPYEKILCEKCLKYAFNFYLFQTNEIPKENFNYEINLEIFNELYVLYKKYEKSENGFIYEIIIKLINILFEKLENTNIQIINLKDLFKNFIELPLLNPLDFKTPMILNLQIEILLSNLSILEFLHLKSLEFPNEIEPILLSGFQIFDLKLAILRHILSENSKEEKYIIYTDFSLYSLHMSIEKTAGNLYQLLQNYLSKMLNFTEIFYPANFREFYASTIGNSDFILNIHPTISSMKTNDILLILKYSEECINLLKYIKKYDHAIFLAYYVIMILFYLKTQLKSSKNEILYHIIIQKFITVLHNLLEIFCSDKNQQNNKKDCLNYILKCTDHYKENLCKITEISNNLTEHEKNNKFIYILHDFFINIPVFF